VSKNTKEKIIAKALKLFNIEGVENITTRHIAKELGISQGNLHYHYPNKNELIKTLFNQFLFEIKNAERFKKDVFKKEDVIGSMVDNYKIMYNYRFFFKDNEIVWRRLPEIKKTLIEVFEIKRQQIVYLIQLYRTQGIFRKNISDDQIEFLAEQFIFSITSWLNTSAYSEEKKDIALYYARFTFRIWLPYLEAKAMKEWEKLL